MRRMLFFGPSSARVCTGVQIHYNRKLGRDFTLDSLREEGGYKVSEQLQAGIDTPPPPGVSRTNRLGQRGERGLTRTINLRAPE